MPRHGGNRRAQPLQRPGIGDGAEQAGHHIEAPPQVEIRHVGEVKGNARIARAGDLDHPRVQIAAFGGEPLRQAGDMRAGTASDVKQGIAGAALMRIDHRAKPRGFGRVVLKTIDRVIISLRLAEQGGVLQSAIPTFAVDELSSQSHFGWN